MKEVAASFAQLAAIIMILITLAVSTAAVTQWVGGDASNSADTVETEAALLTGAQ